MFYKQGHVFLELFLRSFDARYIKYSHQHMKLKTKRGFFTSSFKNVWYKTNRLVYETLSSFRLHVLLNALTLLKARKHYIGHDVAFHVFSRTAMPVATAYLLIYFSLCKIDITFSIKGFSSNCVRHINLMIISFRWYLQIRNIRFLSKDCSIFILWLHLNML